MSATGQVLSKEQVAEFHERGILIVDFGFDPAMLDRIIEKVYEHYPEDFRAGRVPNGRVQDAWKYVDEVRQLASNQQVHIALEQLFGRKPLPFQTLNFPIGTGQRAHSDTIHFSTMPDGFMAGVWVALEDIDMDNGPLIYYPGSHKLPYYSMQDLGLEAGYQQYPQYEEAVENLIAEHGYTPEYGVVAKGQAIIWHANVLHGGAHQRNMSRSRHSQVTHFFFEGCKYYTPMESAPGKIKYRDPLWIPELAEFSLPENDHIVKRAFRRVARKFTR